MLLVAVVVVVIVACAVCVLCYLCFVPSSSSVSSCQLLVRLITMERPIARIQSRHATYAYTAHMEHMYTRVQHMLACYVHSCHPIPSHPIPSRIMCLLCRHLLFHSPSSPPWRIPYPQSTHRTNATDWYSLQMISPTRRCADRSLQWGPRTPDTATRGTETETETETETDRGALAIYRTERQRSNPQIHNTVVETRFSVTQGVCCRFSLLVA